MPQNRHKTIEKKWFIFRFNINITINQSTSYITSFRIRGPPGELNDELIKGGEMWRERWRKRNKKKTERLKNHRWGSSLIYPLPFRGVLRPGGRTWVPVNNKIKTRESVSLWRNKDINWFRGEPLIFIGTLINAIE